MGKDFVFFRYSFYLSLCRFQEPAENLECPELIAAFMAEQKEKQPTSTTATATKSSETSNGKRTHSTNSRTNDDDNNNTSQPKRPRIELEQTVYGRELVPEMLMGATDIYDGELMFL